jgi:serine protease AprX
VLRPQILSIPERLDAAREQRGRGVVMGFVDVGFYPHPDLMQPRRRIKAYADAARDEPIASDFFIPQPFGWHGTMTACCAAGNGYVSGGRYRGLASEAEVVLIKAGIDSGRVLGKHVAHAIRLALRYPHLGIKILNVSVGVLPGDPARDDVEVAVREAVAAGITVFAAAGNLAGQMPLAPGSATEAITVGGGHIRGREEAGEDAPWPSSYGSPRPGVQKPDLLAPAIWVPAPMLPGTLVAREAAALFQLVTVLEEASAEHGFSETRQTATPEERDSVQGLLKSVAARIERRKYISQDYQHVDGTSFASPITASVAAQMLEASPRLTPQEIREGLVSTAVRIKDVREEVQGAGVLQPRRAVEWALGRAGSAAA